MTPSDTDNRSGRLHYRYNSYQTSPELPESDYQNQPFHSEDSYLQVNPYPESDRNAALANLQSAHSEEGQYPTNEDYEPYLHLRGGAGGGGSSSRPRQGFDAWPQLQISPGDVRGYNPQVVTRWQDRVTAAFKTRRGRDTPPLINPSKNYVSKVREDLNTINQPNADPSLIAEMSQTNKPVVITYPNLGTSISSRRDQISANRTESGGDARFFAVYGASTQQQLADFQNAYGLALAHGYTDDYIAQIINAAHAATNQTMGAQSRLQGPITGDQINRWMNGADPLPANTEPEFQYLMYALERYLPKGGGSGSRISYSPYNPYSQGGRRPPVVGLHHEMVHAYHNAIGGKLFTDDDPENEMMTIGYSPFDQVALGGDPRPHTENNFRNQLNLPPRTEQQR